MKIDELDKSNHTFAPALSLSSATSLANNSRDSGTVGGTNFGLDSSKMSALAGLTIQAFSTDDSRTEKVAEVQQSIASGSFEVSASALADSLLVSMDQPRSSHA